MEDLDSYNNYGSVSRKAKTLRIRNTDKYLCMYVIPTFHSPKFKTANIAVFFNVAVAELNMRLEGFFRVEVGLGNRKTIFIAEKTFSQNF
jgi:hypothetical protein